MIAGDGDWFDEYSANVGYALTGLGRSFALRLIKQFIHYLLAVPEIRALEPLEGLCQIKQSAARCKVEHSERPDHAKAFLACYPHALAIIQEQQISAEGGR